MKKSVALLVSVAIVFGSLLFGLQSAHADGVPPTCSRFADVPASSEYAPYICWLASTGVTTGTSATTFSPTANVTRQQMAAFLYRAAGQPAYSPPAKPSFSDVPANSQYFLWIEWLKTTGITTGTSPTTFSPTATVTRQQMAAFLYRLSGTQLSCTQYSSGVGCMLVTGSTPTISGTATVGSTLTATPGTWSPTATLTYQWLRDGVAITGATSNKYVLVAADAGHKITVTVTGSAAGYTPTSKTSAATAAVAAAPLKAFTTTPTPTISGTTTVGSTLTVTPGTWSPTATLTYQWLRDGVAISGATASTYVLVAADLSHKMTVTVTGSASGYTTTSKTSAATAAVAAASLKAFTTAPAPTISGTATVGSTLTVTPGTWSPTATLTYQWLRDGVAITGATSNTYVLVAADSGHKITVTVTGSAAGYTTTSKTSAATAAVAAAAFTTAPTPTISGTAQVGSTLTVTPGTWSPTATLAYQWLSDGVAITGATSSTYVLVAADLSHKITVTVTGSASGYTTTSKTSAATAAVAAASLKAFTTAPTPTISGTATVGSTLTATPGTWSPTATLAYQWLRNGVAISGATASTYVPVAADLSQKITVTVTGSASGYTTTAKTSAPTLIVTPPKVTAVAPASGAAQGGTSVTITGTGLATVSKITFGGVAGTNVVAVSDTQATVTTPAGMAGKAVDVVVTTTGGSVTSVGAYSYVCVSSAIHVSGTISKNTTWSNVSGCVATYVVDSTTDIASGVTLTINSGVVVKFSGGSGFTVDGTLSASGTSSSPVVLTSWRDNTAGVSISDGNPPAAGDWNGVQGQQVSGDQGVVSLSYVNVSYCNYVLAPSLTVASSVLKSVAYVSGSPYRSGDVMKVTGSTIQLSDFVSANPTMTGTTVTITGNTISGGGYVDVWSSVPGLSATVSGNTISGVTALSPYFPVNVDEVALKPSLLGNTLTGNRANVTQVSGTLVENWTIGSGLKWVVGSTHGIWGGNGTVDVAAGETMTLQAGAVVKFDAGSNLLVDGTLSASGTSSSPVVLTSWRDDTVGGDTDGQTGSYDVPFAPAVGDWNSIQIDPYAKVFIDNGDIRYANGLTQTGGTLQANATFNTGYVLAASGTGVAQIRGSYVGPYPSAGRLISSCTVGPGGCSVDASYFNWGAATGPFPAGGPPMACGMVYYSFWVGEPSSGPGYAYAPWSLDNCDGSMSASASISDAITAANTSVNNAATASGCIDMTTCQIINMYHTCLGGAIDIIGAYSGASSPWEWGVDQYVSGASSTIGASSSSLSTVAQMTNYADQMYGAVSDLMAVGQAYSSCAASAG